MAHETRHLFQLANECLASKNDLHLFAAVNLMQDAVEAFLVGVGDHVNATIPPKTDFDKYFVLINAKIAPKVLPFQHAMTQLNRIRVDSKHYAIQPARNECDRMALSVREFFDEVSSAELGANFATVSAIDLIDDGETKNLLLDAKAAHDGGDYAACLITCRKVIYVSIECHYDIGKFKDKDKQPIGLLSAMTSAPYYARNPQYIAEHIMDPTDFIVRDHSRIDQELLKQGVDTMGFWNIYRLTPGVYRASSDDEWIVKYDFGKLDPEGLRDKADYVFATTLDIALALHTSKRALRYQNHSPYELKLAREEVPVYEKADKTSKQVGTTAAGKVTIETSFRVQGLQGDGEYWRVSDFFNGSSWIFGYIHNDDVAA